MVGDDSAGVRIVAPQNHVATFLPPENKSRPFEGCPNLAT